MEMLIYISALSLFAIIITIWDKSAAQKHKRRVPERTLFAIAALGGSAAMLITMVLIRHKTKHKRFMIGLPLIILLQTAAASAIYYS